MSKAGNGGNGSDGGVSRSGYGGHGRDDRSRTERENSVGRDVRAPAPTALPARAVVREADELADGDGTWQPTKRGKRAGRGGDVAAQAERYEERYGAAAKRK